MLAKLSADILDRLDVFILEIEELRVPAPLWWEYIWCLSIVLSFVGLSAAKSNRLLQMQKYMIGLAAVGIVPLLYGLVYYFRDTVDYLTLEPGTDVDDTDIHMWQVRVQVNGLLWIWFIWRIEISTWDIVFCVYGSVRSGIAVRSAVVRVHRDRTAGARILAALRLESDQGLAITDGCSQDSVDDNKTKTTTPQSDFS